MTLFCFHSGLICLFIALACFAQNTMPPSPEEEQHLSQALAEAGASPVDFLRALESHLAKYPQSIRRNEVERALVKGAIEAKDNRRIILYGERVLAREPTDLQVLESVARSLLMREDRESAERALKYARNFEEGIHSIAKQSANDTKVYAKKKEAVKRGLSEAALLQARAYGTLGKFDDAIALASKSYDLFPSEEAAQETGRWLASAGRNDEAVRRYADAFTIADSKATEAQRALDRKRMGEVYAKSKQGGASLGDLVLEAYDRTAQLMAQQKLEKLQQDPNAEAANPFDFKLSGLDSDPLPLSSLKGKVVVMDFWATWCGPCRVQHPLYEEVKKKFKSRPDVVFLAIDTDEERSLVKPFLEDQHWDKKVYFEDGLQRMLKVNSIPTTVIFNKRGELFSRMNGFLPDRFVDMLTERIQEALKENN